MKNFKEKKKGEKRSISRKTRRGGKVKEFEDGESFFSSSPHMHTAFKYSFAAPMIPPDGTCFSGIPTTLIPAGDRFSPSAGAAPTSTKISSKKSTALTRMKDSPSGFFDERCALECGVVMMGSEHRREASTSWLKWSLPELLARGGRISRF